MWLSAQGYYGPDVHCARIALCRTRGSLMKQKSSILIASTILFLSVPLAPAEEATSNVAASASEIDPVMTGDSIPAATVRTVRGDELALADVIAAKPTILIFYRGGW